VKAAQAQTTHRSSIVAWDKHTHRVLIQAHSTTADTEVQPALMGSEPIKTLIGLARTIK
jgi:hypothetical protein